MMHNILDDLANLPKQLKAQTKDKVGKITSALDVSAQTDKYEKKIERAANTAETYLAVSLGLQAVASFAALGIMIYSIKNFNRRPRRKIKVIKVGKGGRK